MPQIPNTDFLFGSSVKAAAAASPAPSAANPSFTLRSSAVTNGGRLPIAYTGDGEAMTLPLEWSGSPAGTKAYAVIMHHIDPEGKAKWYWTLYNIPADVKSLPANTRGIGTLGNNSVNGRTEYAPPHSKGPGDKTYVYTLYSLSAPVKLAVPPAQVNREVLLAAIKDSVLATAEFQVVYARSAGAIGQGGDPSAATVSSTQR
jgi:phosphatidylethanolamine-binding protein (PEBP) family uncharacterized protein